MAAVDLEECVTRVLETLSIAALSLLCDALDAQRALLQAEILKWQAQILKYDILAAKIDVLQATVDAALDPIETKLNVFPTNIVRFVAECADLGDIVTAPAQILSNARSIANNYAFKAREIASFSEELGAAQIAAENLSQKLQDTCDLIIQIIARKQSPPA